jgi:pyruvate dehydrogenase E2 component (dihydrolipoamide acetyltransferase)
MGLLCALSPAAGAQPAAPAAPAAPAPAVPAKQPAKAPKKAPAGKQTGIPVKVDLGPAISALNGAGNDDAIKAAQSLAASGDAAAHDALLDALAFGLSPNVAIAALAALGAHPAPPDVVALVRYAAHRNPGVRSAAVSALAVYPAPAARKALVAALRDENQAVRGAAAAAAAKGRAREAIDPLFELLARNEDSASKALAAMADADLARKIGDHFGKVPEPILASTLGLVLKRPDFGPDPARVELVRAIGKIQDPSAVTALQEYVKATPKNPPRPSRDEADKMVKARVGGGSK